MSGDTTSSDMTWAHAACSVDKLDKTAYDGAVNDRAAHDAKAAAEDGMLDVLLLSAECLSAEWLLPEQLPTGRLLVDRTQFLARPLRSALLMKNRVALGGAGALRGRHFERVVRSGEQGSPHGGSTPR